MKRAEDQIQKRVFEHIRLRSAPGVFAYAVPNGGYRKPIEAAIFKTLGVKSGVPDIAFVKEGKAYFLELKSETGRLSDPQKDCISILQNCGAVCGVAFGLNEALAWLENHELLRGTAA